MKITCPNDPEHKRFLATAHVTETWVVDELGGFLDVVDSLESRNVTHRPDCEDLFECEKCSIQAKVEGG